MDDSSAIGLDRVLFGQDVRTVCCRIVATAFYLFVGLTATPVVLFGDIPDHVESWLMSIEPLPLSSCLKRRPRSSCGIKASKRLPSHEVHMTRCMRRVSNCGGHSLRTVRSRHVTTRKNPLEHYSRAVQRGPEILRLSLKRPCLGQSAKVST